MDIVSNEWVMLGAGWVFMILSELIGASKLKSNGITELALSFLSLIKKK